MTDDNHPPDPDWLMALFPELPSDLYRSKNMLYLIGYDVSCPKRLHHIAKTLENYGLRVQYSFFECRLPLKLFDKLWADLNSIIDSTEDRLVVYVLDSKSQKLIKTAGLMVCSKKVIAYLI